MRTSLLVQANVLQIPLADKSVHVVCTSPPYWNLRSYNTGSLKSYELGCESVHDCAGWATGNNCGQCYVCHMRAVFAEVWRVMRDDGTLWLNLGDSYNGSGGAGGDYAAGGLKDGQPKYSGRNVASLKAKDLCGVPWRVSLALQADGWYLRSDIIWSKPNPMPESVVYRPTKAHEYLFLLSKQPRYFYDADAVSESGAGRENFGQGQIKCFGNSDRRDAGRIDMTIKGYRNRRTVWNIATAPYSGAHFATFPPALVEPCIKAGTSEGGVCGKCGAQYERIIERGYRAPAEEDVIAAMVAKGVPRQKANLYDSASRDPSKYAADPDKFLGWRPTCTCNAPTIPALVYDPFGGSGTTALVAQQLGRRAIITDLSAAYLQLAQDRLGHTALDEWTNGKAAAGDSLAGLPMFADTQA